MALDFLFIKDIISNVPDNTNKAPTIAVKDLPISSQDIVDNIFRDADNINKVKEIVFKVFEFLLALDFFVIIEIVYNDDTNTPRAPVIAIKLLPISSQDIVDNIFKDDASTKIANDMLINDNIVDSEPLLILLILFNIAIAPRTAVKLITIADIELYKFSVLIDARTKIDAASIDIAKDILNILFIFIPVHRYSNESFKL